MLETLHSKGFNKELKKIQFHSTQFFVHLLTLPKGYMEQKNTNKNPKIGKNAGFKVINEVRFQ